jgi:outer membrane lipoprotein carrier protein
MKKAVMLLIMLFTQGVFAETAAEVLQHKLNALRTMNASFNQVIRAKSKTLSRSSGSMALQRPGKFRWETKTPMEQLVVADGQHIWVYDVDLEQVTVKKQAKGLSGTPALFLGGYTDTVTRDFNVSMAKKGQHDVFDLRPKSKANSHRDNFRQIKLEFAKDALIAIEFFDELGQHTTVGLSKVKVNPTLSSRLFAFKPPKGADVVDQ